MISGLITICGGLLAASGFFVSRARNAQQLIDKLTPYQGWIGAVSAIWGAWGVVNAVLHLTWLTVVPIFWITFTASAVLQLALGILLGVGIFKSFVTNPEANKRMDQTVAKLAPFQTKFGLAAIGVGAWLVVCSFMWRI